MTYFPRSAWTSAPKGGVVLKGTGRTMTTIYIHYPGQGAAIGNASVAATKRRLEGYRRMHKNVNGWADIAYNVAVDQAGNVWELRGIDRQSGANGGTRSNRSGQAVLVLVGNNEKPTAACLDGIREAVRRIRAQHPQATRIRGHQQSPDASTACPGPHLMGYVRSGALEPGKAAAAPAKGTSAPASAPAPVKAGKAPAFPLPRRAGAMFYYGPAGGPIESVSGMGRNSRVPEDVYQDSAGRWHSRGLAQFQARLIARGWGELKADGADGRFGKTMAKVVRQFQDAMGLPVDGKIGPDTWRAAWETPVR